MSDATILLDARFDPRVKSYWIWKPVLALTLGIVTIPIAILYAIIAGLFIDRYLANLRCTLTARTLDIKKGIWNKTESTIPLDKITDLQLLQGPVMRYFGLHGFKVETAGQSSPTGGALVNIIGIEWREVHQPCLSLERLRSAPAIGKPPNCSPRSVIHSSGSSNRSHAVRISITRDRRSGVV